MCESELIEIVLRPETTGAVVSILDEIGVEWFSLKDVQGVGRQKGHTEIFRGREYDLEFRPKVRLEVLVNSLEQREQVIRRISDHVRTGRVGDGKIFLMKVEVPDSKQPKNSALSD